MEEFQKKACGPCQGAHVIRGRCLSGMAHDAIGRATDLSATAERCVEQSVLREQKAGQGNHPEARCKSP